MLEKPTDIIVMFALIGVAFATIGLGITSIEAGGLEVGETEIFSNIGGDLQSTTGLLRSANSSTNVLDPNAEETLGQTTEENFLFRGLQGLRDIAATYKSFENALTQSQNELGIPAYITGAVVAVLICMLFLSIYVYWRGRV